MINLLPETHKKELREERKFLLLLVLLSVFTTALVCFALMLGVLRVYLASSVLSQESTIALLEMRFSQDNPVLAEVQAFNEKVSQIKRFLKSSHPISPILQALAQVLSPGMYLTSFDYDPVGSLLQGGEARPVNARIQVSGFAENRETLFVFRESIQKHPLFSELVFPASNWVQPADIRFSLQTSINPQINSGPSQ